MQRKPSAMTFGAVLLTLAILLTPIPLLTSAQYQALAGGVQAFGVTVALLYGGLALYLDARNRKIDRVLSLHDVLTNGSINEARVRLVNHLRDHGADTNVRRVSAVLLRKDPELLSYPSNSSHSPILDLNRLLRFMERADSARAAGLVDLSLFHELIGLHILWWNKAIFEDANEPLRRRLASLADWVTEYHTRQKPKPAYVSDWEVNLRRDFETRP